MYRIAERRERILNEGYAVTRARMVIMMGQVSNTLAMVWSIEGCVLLGTYLQLGHAYVSTRRHFHILIERLLCIPTTVCVKVLHTHLLGSCPGPFLLHGGFLCPRTVWRHWAPRPHRR